MSLVSRGKKSGRCVRNVASSKADRAWREAATSGEKVAYSTAGVAIRIGKLVEVRPTTMLRLSRVCEVPSWCSSWVTPRV